MQLSFTSFELTVFYIYIIFHLTDRLSIYLVSPYF